MTSYIALLHKEENSSFGVSFPDFPGCITGGDTLEQARKRAPEVLAFHIKGMLEDGEAIPTPSSLDEIMDNPENADAVAFLVDGPKRKVKHVRINITVPEDTLDLIDRGRGRISRSQFFTEAARRRVVNRL